MAAEEGVCGRDDSLSRADVAVAAGFRRIEWFHSGRVRHALADHLLRRRRSSDTLRAMIRGPYEQRPRVRTAGVGSGVRQTEHYASGHLTKTPVGSAGPTLRYFLSNQVDLTAETDYSPWCCAIRPKTCKRDFNPTPRCAWSATPSGNGVYGKPSAKCSVYCGPTADSTSNKLHSDIRNVGWTVPTHHRITRLNRFGFPSWLFDDTTGSDYELSAEDDEFVLAVETGQRPGNGDPDRGIWTVKPAAHVRARTPIPSRTMRPK